MFCYGTVAVRSRTNEVVVIMGASHFKSILDKSRIVGKVVDIVGVGVLRVVNARYETI